VTLQELAPGLWRWTRRHPDWHPHGFGDEVASFAVRDEAGLVLVDPLLDDGDDPVLAALEAKAAGSVRILITIPYHVRSAERIWRHLRGQHDVAIHGHARCAGRLEDTSGFRAVSGCETLAGGIRTFSIGKPRRMEVPFELPSHRALAFGDAIVATGGGALRVWKQWEHVAADWYEGRFLPTLRPLAELDVDRVLVTHGEPVLQGGARALAKALDAPPWSRT
jgi:glyoxylase-like metal-dependent hydrolase (beta-lactamase superfamily II)